MCVVSPIFFLNTRELNWYRRLILYLKKVCGVRPCHSNEKRRFPTCSMTCAEKLAEGGGPQNMCEVSLNAIVSRFSDRVPRIVLSQKAEIPELSVLRRNMQREGQGGLSHLSMPPQEWQISFMRKNL